MTNFRIIAAIRFYRGFRTGTKIGIRFNRRDSAKAAIRFIHTVGKDV